MLRGRIVFTIIDDKVASLFLRYNVALIKQKLICMLNRDQAYIPRKGSRPLRRNLIALFVGSMDDIPADARIYS